MQHIRVTAAIIVENGRILATQRHDHDSTGGKWEFPGGKIEPGETPEACLRRELQEELGVDAEIGELFMETTHAYPSKTVELLVYHAAIRAGTIALHAHQACRWMQINELDQLDWLAADRPIVAKIQSQKSCQTLAKCLTAYAEQGELCQLR